MNDSIASIRNPRWLLVDDNEEMLTTLAVVLENLTSAEIEFYSSPQSALAAFTAAPEQYELVITDFQMPEMDGVELCRRIRELAPEQKIFLTTGSGYFSELAARHHGFCALLNKPFRLAELRNALATAGAIEESTFAI